MRSLALLLLILFVHPAQAMDCKPRTLSEYFDCQKGQEAERILKVFRTAGEVSSYWPCLRAEVTAASKRAEAAKNLIDTSEELNQLIMDAQVACETYFPAFETALRKEAGDQGFEDDIDDPQQLRFLVYELWFTALTSS